MLFHFAYFFSKKASVFSLSLSILQSLAQKTISSKQDPQGHGTPNSGKRDPYYSNEALPIRITPDNGKKTGYIIVVYIGDIFLESLPSFFKWKPWQSTNHDIIFRKNPVLSQPNQWSFLVPLIGGKYHIITQLAIKGTRNNHWTNLRLQVSPWARFLLASSLFGAPWSAMSAVVGSTLASLPEAAELKLPVSGGFCWCFFFFGAGSKKNKGPFWMVRNGEKMMCNHKMTFFSWYVWILWNESEFHLVVLAFFFVIEAEPYFKVAGLFWMVDVPWILFGHFREVGQRMGTTSPIFPSTLFWRETEPVSFP